MVNQPYLSQVRPVLLFNCKILLTHIVNKRHLRVIVIDVFLIHTAIGNAVTLEQGAVIAAAQVFVSTPVSEIVPIPGQVVTITSPFHSSIAGT